jgi:hypothetical protein
MTDRFSDEGQPNSDLEEQGEGCRAGNGLIVSVANCLLTFDSSMRYLLNIHRHNIHVVCESGHLQVPRTVAGR